MRSIVVLACLCAAALSKAQLIASQLPPTGGGTMRVSKLWIDPTGQNEIDGDAICYEDFTLASPASIDHLEWWGSATPNLGFQIEFWKQDPGTIAYQPLAVFRESGAHPEAAFQTTEFTSTSDPSGTTHFTFDLAVPVSLAANDDTNPRWFVSVIGLTSNASFQWNWAQGLGGSTRTYQWVRQTVGPQFRVLGEGRAMVISAGPVPEPNTILGLVLGTAYLAGRRRRRKTASGRIRRG